MWTDRHYDPELKPEDVGTGNPTPGVERRVAHGGQPGTCSIVALDPIPEKLAWGFQASRTTSTIGMRQEVRSWLTDARGAPRKLRIQA